MEIMLSEMDLIYRHLKNTIENLDSVLYCSGKNDVYEEAKAIADLFEPNELISLKALDEPYKKDRYPDRASEAYVRNLILFIKAKQSFENGKIQIAIDLLLNYYFQQGQIAQSVAEEEGFKTEAIKHLKCAADKRYKPDRLIKAEACSLLRKHKPQNGWENRTKAANAISEDLKSFFKNNCSGSYLDIKNLDKILEKWLSGKSADVSETFKETASQEWKNRYDKNK